MQIIATKITDPYIVKITARFLKQGGIIIYPTDTLYGLGVNAQNEKAVALLRQIKKREAKIPFSIIVKDLRQAKRFAFIKKAEEKIFKKYLPGPYTFVLRKKKNLSSSLTARKATVGLRIPNHPFTKKLSASVSFPYVTTSANLSGKKPLYKSSEIMKVFSKIKNAPILFLDFGDLQKSLPSTVIDLTKQPYKILRQGAGKWP